MTDCQQGITDADESNIIICILLVKRIILVVKKF